MSVDPSLDQLTREELVARARELGARRPEVMTRVELRDEIVRLSESDPAARRRSRGWLGVARDLVASVVDAGLNMPSAAAAIRGDARPAEETTGPPPVATLTLAEIYLAQGHVERALGVLGEVLAAEPEHAAALELRERILTERDSGAFRRRPLAATDDAEAGFVPSVPAPAPFVPSELPVVREPPFMTAPATVPEPPPVPPVIPAEQPAFDLTTEAEPHGDVTAAHGDVTAAHGVEAEPHGDVTAAHGDVTAAHGDVTAAHGVETEPHVALAPHVAQAEPYHAPSFGVMQSEPYVPQSLPVAAPEPPVAPATELAPPLADSIPPSAPVPTLAAPSPRPAVVEPGADVEPACALVQHGGKVEGHYRLPKGAEQVLLRVVWFVPSTAGPTEGNFDVALDPAESRVVLPPVEQAAHVRGALGVEVEGAFKPLAVAWVYRTSDEGVSVEFAPPGVEPAALRNFAQLSRGVADSPV